MSGQQHQEHTYFPRVPDESDAGFNRNDPRMMAESKQQRVREIKVAEEEVSWFGGVIVEGEKEKKKAQKEIWERVCVC